jgi:hypothetical protein
VAGSFEDGDAPLSSGTTELVVGHTNPPYSCNIHIQDFEIADANMSDANYSVICTDLAFKICH